MNFNDHRQYDFHALYWGVATYRMLSRWGQATGGVSYVAYPLYTREDMDAFDKYAASRRDFMRPRVQRNLPRKGQVSAYDRPWIDHEPENQGTQQSPFAPMAGPTKRHELVFDTAGFNPRPRITCTICNKTLVAQPWMNQGKWDELSEKFLAEHSE